MMMRNAIAWLVLLAPTAILAKQLPQYPVEQRPPAIEPAEYSASGRVGAATRVPQALYGLKGALLQGTPESMARDFLGRNAAALQLRDAGLGDLRHVWTRSSLSGHNVHFEQQIAGVPVYASRMVVHISPGQRVSFVTSGYRPQAALSSTQPLVSAEQAQAVLVGALQAQRPFGFERTELVAYPAAGTTRLAWQVQLEAARPIGSWEALVDAINGETLVLWDRSAYASGTVFNPDPLSSSGTAYGDKIDDRDDADYEAINNEIVTVDLGELPFVAGRYFLADQWAEVIDHESPFYGTWEQESPEFHFTRSQDGFEPVNTFWHIQQSMRYINETLGIPLRPYQYDGGVRFDPQGLDGDDNSHYTPGSGNLAFGEGCVDDDEDADVIWHELGHGLHDWVTNGGLSNIVDGLSEGFGDYWAQSHSRSLGQWGPDKPEYHWVFNWDGHNECWGGRVSNIALPYPTSVQPFPLVHSGGQHWSTCLMRIYDQIGREKTDTITLEGLAMTHMLSSQNDAANAVMQAAADIGLPADEQNFIADTFLDCGYVVAALLPDPPATPAPVLAPLADNAKFGGAMGGLLLLAGAAFARRRG
jgi:hypothetical protein